jgi:membrane-associated phospholipid phosphatase
VTIDAELARERARRLVVVALVSGALVAILYGVAVHTRSGQRFDSIALGGRTTRAAVLHLSVRLLDTISIASLTLGSAVVLAVAFARRRPRLALAAGAILLGANVSTQLLKKAVLERPDLGVLERLHALANTFPSGHATVAMSLAVTLVLVVPNRVRPWAALGGCAYAALIGISSVTAGKHRPSDVLGAYLVVMTWAGAMVAALLWTRGAQRVPLGGALERVSALRPFLVGTAVGVLVGALAAVVGTIVTSPQPWFRDLEPGAAYVASVTVIGAMALLSVLTVLVCVHDIALDPPGAVPE